jgi:hypothetical protein
LASPFLHKVTLKPANQHKNWPSDGISFFYRNKVEVGCFFVAMAKKGENSVEFF